MSGLTEQLIGFEGWRVEVVTASGKTERFIVSRSIGSQPCHVKLKRRNSIGGEPADYAYARILPLYPVRNAS
jgi:hypothetical protein